MPTSSARSSGRTLTKVLIGIASAVILVVVAVVVLVPAVASSILTGDVPVDLPSGRGTLSLRDVAVRWGGPQRIGKATLADAAGRRMADLSVEARSSLVGLALGGFNFGTIAVSGEIDVSEDQLTRQGGASTPTPPAPPSKRGRATTINRNLRVVLDAGPMTITYTPRPDSGLSAVRIDGLRAKAMISGAGLATLRVEAASPTIDVSAELRNFVDRSGRVAPAGAEGDLSARVSAPGELIEALARMALGPAGGGRATASAGAAATEIDASVKIEKGRLRLADASRPAMIRGPVPAAVIELLAAEGVRVEITNSPSVAQTILALDVPLPDAKGAMDLRGAAVHARIETTAVEGRIALAETAARPFRVEPVEFEARAPDLAQGFHARARTRGTLDGRDAGALEAGFDAQGLLDDAGGFRKGLPGALRGSLSLTGVPTGLAQALADRLGVRLEEVVGPTVDARVSAETAESPAGSAALPAVRVRADVTAARVKASLSAEVDEREVVIPGEGLTVEMDRVGAAARGLLKDSGIEVGDGGRLVLKVRDVKAPMVSAGLPDLGRVAGGAEVVMSGVVIEKGLGDRPIEARSLTARVALAGDQGPPRVSIDGVLDAGGGATTVRGEVELAGLISRRDGDWPFIDITPAKTAPRGQVAMTGLPTALIGAFVGEYAGLAQEVAGPSVDVALAMPAPSSPGVPEVGPRSAAVSVRGANVSASASAGMDDRSIRLGQADISLTVTPSLVSAAAAQFAPGVEPRPGLAGPAIVKATVFPTAVDLDAEGRPDVRTLRPVRAMATVEGDVVLTGLPGGVEEKALRAGLRGVEIGGEYNRRDPLRSEGSLKATVFDPAEPGAVVAKVNALATLMNPPPAFDVKVEEIDTARLDRLLHRPGLVSDLLGESAGVGMKGSAKEGVQDVVLALRSTRATTALALRRTVDRVELVQPASVEIEAPAAWANSHLAPAEAGGKAASLQFIEAVRATVQVSRLSLSTGGPAFKPGVFALEARASSPTIKIQTGDGQAVDFQSLTAAVRSDREGRGVSFDVSATRVGLAGAGSTQPVKAVGQVWGLFDDEGNVSAEGALVNAEVSGTLPTAVLDALANRGGLLVDLLGANTRLDLKATGFSRESGTVNVAVNTDNARASLKGKASAGMLVADGPANITLTRITRDLSARFVETAIPLLARVEKTPSDEPAVIDAVNLTLPLDNDTRKINGDITVDPGTVQFETATFFGKIVQFTGNLAGGRMGERIEPFQIKAREGVLTYEKVEIPLGEFVVSMSGKVDLNRKRMDIITYVPFYALVKEVSAPLSAVPGIGRLTQIPIRVHGPFDDPKTEVKPELIVKENLGEAVKEVLPEPIKKTADDLLKDVFKKKK